MPAANPIKAITAAACAIFVGYAGCFAYFFVDDEGIPLVYARNLLRGRGLVYTVIEGRVEGYSDFLHVMWSTVLLAVTRVLKLSPVAPLLVGKGVSLAAAIALIVWTARTLERQAASRYGIGAALAFLALAGPLAVWGMSSLETVVFALTVFLFAVAAWDDRLVPAVVLGSLIVLERIDGPVYVLAVLAGGLAIRTSAVARLTRIGVLIGAVAAAFHAWRWSYFGTILSAPLAAKVLYRLDPPPHAVIKVPNVSYLAGLIHLYGWYAVVLLVLAALAALRSPLARASIVTVVCLGLYAERVDDWMFGWRFTVAMLPFIAVVLGVTVSRLSSRMQVAAAAAVAAVSLLGAWNFIRLYERTEGRPLFWTSPRGGEADWFGRYDELVTRARLFVRAGDRIAYDQAGLIPYLLDAENLDDLGICSRFVARLPTTDVYYTAVGRYSPLTNAPVVRTAHAYLLHQQVRVIIEPADLSAKANDDRIPDVVLDGAYRRAEAPLHDNVIYVRTDKPIDRFVEDPSSFTENLVHVSRIIRATIDGQRVAGAELEHGLRFLREQRGDDTYAGSHEIALLFARHDEAALALYAGRIATRVPGTLTIALYSETGREVFRSERQTGPAGETIFEPLPPGTRANLLVLSAHADSQQHLMLSDVRLAGQTQVLRDYVLRNLVFRPRAGSAPMIP